MLFNGIRGYVGNFDWITPKKLGQFTMLSRAKDANGEIQPDKHNQNYATYVINHFLPIEVIVGDPWS
jgi:hypothetical protein